MIMPLTKIAEIRMGYSFRSRLEVDAEGDVAVIQMKDIDDSHILYPEKLAHIYMPDLKDHHLVKKGDLLFRSRGNSNFVSRVASNLGRTVLAAPMMLIRPQTNMIKPSYLQWFINQSSSQNILLAQAKGTAVKMISKASLEQLLITIPSLTDQQRIVEISQLVVQEANLMKKLMERRRGLIEGMLMQKAQGSC